jgi:hypothetical protein
MTKHLVLLGLLVSSIVLTGCESCRTHTPQNATQMKLPTGTPQRPQGMKALTVTPGPTPFTANDVTQYVRTHRLARMIGDMSQLTVTNLEFMTAREVTNRLQNESTGLPDDQRVAFATIQGPLYFTGPSGSKTAAFETAYAVFDAQTGNLLMSGTLNAAKPTTGRPQ